MGTLFKRIVVGLIAVVMVFTSIIKPVTVKADETEERYGSESVYTDGTSLTAVKEIASPDGKVVAKLWKDDSNRYFYSASINGECVIYASALGMVTKEADFSTGVNYKEGKLEKITDDYQLLNGKHDGQISDVCNQFTFDLEKDGKNLTVNIRVYDDGVAYNYKMNEGATVEKEVSESVFADDAYIWTYTHPNHTYEGTYVKISMNAVYNVAATYTVPSLVETGNNWVLITEASVFDDEQSYCSSLLKTVKDSKNLQWTFGNKQSNTVVMKEAFETPWRVAVIGDSLDTIVNSDIVTSVCNDAKDYDFSFVKPGKLAWSWWSSTGDDPISFEPQFEYIDFAAANGWEYVCLDYGWVLWDDYKAKVKELVDYAAKKGVGIWLWYGVNDVGHTAAGAYPKYSLLKEETIREELTWAGSIGVKGVKVDYYESDGQTAMKQMYLCAKIAAECKQMVLFHGCTVPGGENRTFPNVLSYEAVYGAEYYKWRTEPSTANIITYLFTRNAVGSADFTPTALPVAGINATHGFMLATALYIESGLVHFAENVNVYEGYNGLSLMNDMPVTWDETKVLEGMPGKYGTVARRQGADWYIASLTTDVRTTEAGLDFLEEGKTYTAYIYKTNEAKNGIEIVTKKVTSKDILAEKLGKNDGFSVKITESEFDYVTDYEKNYIYLEAENATYGGKVVHSSNAFNAQYSSGKKTAEYIGSGAENCVTYSVNVDEAGVYEINLFYISANDRRFMISVNGDDANRIRTGKLNSGDWVTVKKEAIYVELVKGDNTIKIYNDETFAPNLDRISISKNTVNEKVTVSDEEKDDIQVSAGEKYEYKEYEAEKATIAGGATNENTLVGWIGGNGHVTFENIKVKADGTYYLKIWYMTAEDRDFVVTVNDGKDITVKCPSNGDYYGNPGNAYVEVKLNKGVNTIKLSNPSGNAPNLDKIGISLKSLEEEVTTEETTEKNEVKKNEEKNNVSLLVVFAVLVPVFVVILIVAVVVILIISLKKKGKKNGNIS